MNALPAGLEVLFLFDAPFVLPGPKAFLEEMNPALKPRGLTFRPMDEGAAMRFQAPGFVLEIAVEDRPVSAHRLAAALASPLTRAKPGVTERVMAHTHSLRIALRDDGGQTPSIKAASGVLHRAALALLALTRPVPSLVFWAQSDTLHRPEAVLRTAGEALPLALLLRPESLVGTGERAPLYVARGSELFCGRTIVVEGSTLHPEELRNLVEIMILGHGAGEMRLEDGEVIPVSDGEQARLSLVRPDDRFPQGRIAVRIESFDPADEAAFAALLNAMPETADADEPDDPWMDDFLPLRLIPPVAFRIDEDGPSTLSLDRPVAFSSRRAAEDTPLRLSRPLPRRVTSSGASRAMRPERA